MFYFPVRLAALYISIWAQEFVYSPFIFMALAFVYFSLYDSHIIKIVSWKYCNRRSPWNKNIYSLLEYCVYRSRSTKPGIIFKTSVTAIVLPACLFKKQLNMFSYASDTSNTPVLDFNVMKTILAICGFPVV